MCRDVLSRHACGKHMQELLLQQGLALSDIVVSLNTPPTKQNGYLLRVPGRPEAKAGLVIVTALWHMQPKG